MPNDELETTDERPRGELPAPVYQLVVCWEDEMRVYDLPERGEVTIGRAEGNVVCIDDPSVSRQHAILRIGTKLSIEDLGAQNGTFLRDRRNPQHGDDTLNLRQLVKRSADLAVGDAVMFGTTSAVVRRAPAGAPSEVGSGAIVSEPAMKEVYAQAARAARSTISVIILGETGVGKEVLARAIHRQSPRAAAPFMDLNCAALADSIIESELFGAEKGAFTGALSARTGLLESADTGTVFLDEIGEMPLGTQAKFLRVLEERTVMRLGSNRARPIDVRFLAATNRDLEAEARAGRFRQDLFFRLNGICLTIPPLRERPTEIELLATSFLAAESQNLERNKPLSLSARALAALKQYRWPGNVRELKNAMQRAAVLCAADVVMPEHLPPAVRRNEALGPPATTASLEPAVPDAPDVGQLKSQIKSLERARIVETLDRCGGNQTRAAQELGISRRTLVSRMAELDLPRPRKPASGGG